MFTFWIPSALAIVAVALSWLILWIAKRNTLSPNLRFVVVSLVIFAVMFGTILTILFLVPHGVF